MISADPTDGHHYKEPTEDTNAIVYINFVKKKICNIKLEKPCSACLIYDCETQMYSYPNSKAAFRDELADIVRECFDEMDLNYFIKKVRKLGQISQTSRPDYRQRLKVALFEEDGVDETNNKL